MAVERSKKVIYSVGVQYVTIGDETLYKLSSLDEV